MQIEFRRTGERRYAVIIERSAGQILEMNPAPGYDPLMPHDMLHYVVESELGLKMGIFGQVAKGGGAGTFVLTHSSATNQRELSRKRKHQAKRTTRLRREGSDELLLSEHAVYTCQREWFERSVHRRATSRPNALVLAKKPRRHNGISADRLDRICARLDELSKQWSQLDIGEAVMVSWYESK